ncbi:hypothetical protein BKA19_0160 [Blastococcus saxobsidens]|uniref:Uncharacterized protein n=1 Tax=Blastococcus saxobsidens TaxID=138336 RepID=A0A4Q7Y195_9ACTN|nr:hypothetical protein BKA19_0160 [Blastococcus saxobsidens]
MRRHVTPSAALRTVDPISYVPVSSPARSPRPSRLSNRTRSRADTPYASRSAQSVVTSSRRRGDISAVSRPNGMPRGRQRRTQPLAQDRCASRRGVLRGHRALPSSRAGIHVASEGQWRAGWGDVGPVGSSPPPPPTSPPRRPPASRQLSQRHRRRRCPTGAIRELRLPALRGGACGHSGEVRCAAPARPPPVRPQHRVQCPAEGGHVPVVDAAVIQLTGELAEQPRPVPAGRLEGYTNLDPPLDHLHCRPTGVRGAALLPGSMPAGGRAPLRDGAAAARGDRSAAPSADRRGGASFRPVRRWGAPVRTGAFHRGVLALLAVLLLARPPSSPVLGGAAGSHGLKSAGSSPVTRHHESSTRKTCDAL